GSAGGEACVCVRFRRGCWIRGSEVVEGFVRDGSASGQQAGTRISTHRSLIGQELQQAPCLFGVGALFGDADRVYGYLTPGGAVGAFGEQLDVPIEIRDCVEDGPVSSVTAKIHGV